MVRYLVFILSLFLAYTVPAAAQSSGEEFKRELSYGVNLNSNGGLIGGAFIRSSRFVQDRIYQFGGLEVVEIKHPKEFRIDSRETGDFFIFGKQNYLFALRPHYGREFILFHKAAESGVQVNAIGAAGPSIGLLVPYYIRYNYGSQSALSQDVRTEAYDPDVHRLWERIQGNANVFTGLAESKVNFGVHTKAGLSFEYGRYQESITGIEVGFMFEQYLNRLVMIPNAESYSRFISVYLNIYYGSRK